MARPRVRLCGAVLLFGGVLLLSCVGSYRPLVAALGKETLRVVVSLQGPTAQPTTTTPTTTGTYSAALPRPRLDADSPTTTTTTTTTTRGIGSQTGNIPQRDTTTQLQRRVKEMLKNTPGLRVGMLRSGRLRWKSSSNSGGGQCNPSASLPVVCRECCVRRTATATLDVLVYDTPTVPTRVQYPVAFENSLVVNVRRGGQRQPPAGVPRIAGTTQLIHSTHTANAMFSFILLLNALHTREYAKLDDEATALPSPHRITLLTEGKAHESYLDLLARTTAMEVVVGEMNTHEELCYEVLVLGECLLPQLRESSVPEENLFRNAFMRPFQERLRESMGLQPSTAPPMVQRVLLILRPKDAKRHRAILNEDEVLEMLGEFDVEVRAQDVALSDTLDATAEMFDWADMVIAVHGASLANTVFCRPGTVVVELRMYHLDKEVYDAFARAFALRYVPVFHDEAHCPPTPESKQYPKKAYDYFRLRDVIVDVPSLRDVLTEHARPRVLP